jgi:polyisoprenoid-binding protein YceI
MDMTSITVEDLTGEGAKKLGGHLKSDDFFGVTAHPTSKFVITKVVSRGTPGAYKIIGNLNLKAATKELRFNADIKTIEGKQTAVAKIKLDRSEYDIRYGSGSFFDNLGDKTIYDEFDLEINLVYKKYVFRLIDIIGFGAFIHSEPFFLVNGFVGGLCKWFSPLIL